MTNTETRVKIRGRQMNVAADGLSPIEISSIVGQVEERIKRIEEKTTIPDTATLATLAAFEFAAELYNLKRKSEVNSEADGKKIDELVEKLEKTMEKGLF
ncbi:MAG: hypothetical protein A2X34_06375 [Elusimicrobia bacterium GWC2_51_8]|nr:MAG: hypothetical protein A2X33_08200 [Elusimicrobia bacterium GWA2_51_34]OGR61247.1 MAG: hypothetical protein A2X34_06375 [Elusimicrobia bacterium GWC2_51_8]OGR87549.1 MAG: hypothetical protein A2021_04660 [Elusimicrobia bacterium GWF2_52_66]